MRIPESTPLMNDINQCIVYNKYTSNASVLAEYVQTYKLLIGVEQGTVIDLGSGTCNFIIALAQQFPNLQFVCYEASDAMIKIAKENITTANLSSRIRLVHDDMMNATGIYDVILANRVLHHINEYKQFWQLINALGDTLLIVDINRPPENVINHILKNDEYEDSIYKEDLINSMQAAYSLKEVSEQIKEYNYNIKTDNFYRLFVYHTR
jgi:trans-aconitate methyltransferase